MDNLFSANAEILHTFVDTIPIAFFVKDAQSRILLMNKACEAQWGMSLDDLYGTDASQFFPPEQMKQFLTIDQQAFEHGRPFDFEETFWSAAYQGNRIGHTFKNPTFDAAGRPQYLICAMIDITERKHAEAALLRGQKMEALSQLSAGLAHDFNNLLAIITGNLDFLEDTLATDAKSLKRVRAALDAADRGADITRRMLKFSGVDTAPAQARRTHDINGLVRNMLEIFRRTLGPAYTLDSKLAATPLLAQVDATDLQNSLLNLALNARDAMPKGGVLQIHTRRATPAECALPDLAAGPYLLLEVTDHGCGMSRAVRERAFEPFFSTKAHTGTGLGLAMVYRFVTGSDGHISVYSEEGQGTRFEILLPLMDDAAVSANPPNESDVAPPRGTEKILVVDDEAELRQLVTQQLSGLGYRIFNASNAEDALNLLKTQPVDLLFSDVVMPGSMPGTELAAQAQQRYPGLRVLLTSGFPQKIANDPAYARYAGNLLNKPYRYRDLAQRVRTVLDTPPPNASSSNRESASD